jgi:Zn-dependent protease with chaperone function
VCSVPTATASEHPGVIDLMKNADAQVLVTLNSEDDRETRREISGTLKDRTKMINEILASGVVITDSLITRYYEQIVERIVRGNPFLPANIRLMVVRYNWPNAVCFGNGILMLNLGLVEKLENESQVAFVIGHELAHQFGDHVNTKIVQHAKLMNSESIRKGIRDASREKDGSKSALLGLLKSATFDIRKHGRDHETEADSLSLRFMANTGYNLNQAVRAIELLDSIDIDIFAKSILSFRWFFDSLPVAYKQQWEYYNGKSSLQSIVNKADLELPDSMKTHPDCKYRKEALLRQLHNLNLKGERTINPQGDSLFRFQLHQAYTEVLYGAFADSSYALAVYKAMEMCQLYPDDAFPHLLLGMSLAEINLHQRSRTLGKVLPIPAYTDDNPFDRTIAFLNELSRSETAALAYHYVRKNVGEIAHNEDYLYAMCLTSYTFDKPEDMSNYKTAYTKAFSEGRYARRIARLKSTF